MNNKYYISAGKKLLSRFDRNSGRFRNALKFYIKDQNIDEIVNKSKQEFESLIPEIPYIGGNSDRYTKDLIYCTMLLALYKVLKRKRYSTDMIGQVIIKTEELRVSQYPIIIRRMYGMLVHSPFGRQRLRITAKKSLNNPYDGRWMSVFIKGDGSEFDFGVDYYECGICKFFDIQDASEITPYLCHFDFIQQKAMKTGFFRTMTIASGDQKCDFRWKKGAETNSDWHRND